MARQLRLLLWKDYLTRKRKIVTLAGIVWATAVLLSIYIVRANIDNQNYSTCQFPARALPSAGMLPFLQSFMCSINNECATLDKFDEIPTYENSKLTLLQRQFAPLLYNETVLNVAGTVPDALKLLSKLAEVVDEPTFVDISKNGLRVKDLFASPARVKRYLSSRLKLDNDVMNSLMTSELSFQGIFKGNMNLCNPGSLSETLTANPDHVRQLSDRLCGLTDTDLQGILVDLIREVDFDKFIKMIGNMYNKLSGDDRLTALADTVTAVIRVSRLQHFLPREVQAIFTGDQANFSYFDLNLIQKFVDLFKPTFGDTESFSSIKDFADTITVGVRYLHQFIAKTKEEVMETKDEGSLKNVHKALDKAVEVFKTTVGSEGSVDVFNVLAQVTKFITRWLPQQTKHDVLLYSTLLTKLIEGANKVITINMNIEERTYEVAQRHPEAVNILVGLPTQVFAKGLEGLADAERTQVMTSKLLNPGQMFCDPSRLQNFLQVSKAEASSLRAVLCTDAWKAFVKDLIWSFGVYDVKENINTMASLLIQETLGKDTSDKLYTIDQDFQVLKNFTASLTRATQGREKVDLDWIKLFNVSEDSEFMKTVRSKGYLGKQMLIIAHGALAKEVVNQNPILSYKISPGLIDTTTVVTALNDQLEATSKPLVARAKEIYPAVLKTIVRTALVEEKTYKSLSAHSEDIMCNGVDTALGYLELPADDPAGLTATLCDLSRTIEGGLEKDSIFGKALQKIRSSKSQVFDEVKWTTLINGLRDLYVKLDRDYPYLFEYDSYGMSEKEREEVRSLVQRAESFWFGQGSLGRSVRLGVLFGFRVLDLADRPIFNVTSADWLKVKYTLHTVSAPLTVVHDFVQTVGAIYHNESYPSRLPPATAQALERIVPNVPQLLADGVSIVINNSVELEPIISLLNSDAAPWPCSADSLSALLPLRARARLAVAGIEALLCLDANFTAEWAQYLDEKGVTAFNLKNFNKTSYPPHVYLEFSTAVNGFIADISLLRNVSEDIASQDAVEGSWTHAWGLMVDVLKRGDRDVLFRNLFKKLDTVLSALTIPSSPIPLYGLWQEYAVCKRSKEGRCGHTGRAAGRGALHFVATVFSHAASDLLIYFRESNEPNTTVLQLFGFTRNTPLYGLYEKLPEFAAVLLHSYFDYGFMSQIRRASLTQFWDCEAVLSSLVPPPGSAIDGATIRRIQPYVCVSFLYWLGLPRDDNKILDIVAKPNYYFYTHPAANLTGSYEEAYNNVMNLTNFMADIVSSNRTLLTEDELKMNSIQYKYEQLIDRILNYRINSTDTFYRSFYEINKKYFLSSIYLTRLVAIINKIATAIEELDVNKTDISNEQTKKKFTADLIILQKTFKRRPVDIIALHFDVLTDVIWKNDNSYGLSSAMESTCNDLTNNDTAKVVLVDNTRVLKQICSKLYKDMYRVIETDLTGEYEDARISLLNLVTLLRSDDGSNVTNIFEFINLRRELVQSLRTSIKHSYELSLPIYLKYLQSNLRHYDVITAFLTGNDWWTELKGLYNGPMAGKFFESVEISFEILEDVLNGFDRIHLVRLLRDINVNSSDAFCSTNVVLSDYIPDSTERFSLLKSQICDEDKTGLFRELPPLLFASQGYEATLRIPKEVNYTSLQLDLSRTEANLDLMTKELKSPQRPPWVTDDKLTQLRAAALKVLSKESMIRMAFGVLSNVVDGGTLFLNISQCTMCSQLTSWMKQLNLQLFKRSEYDALYCRLTELSLDELHTALRNDFHWDMAITQLIQTRNYTKNELNKSLNEFLELVKLHLLEDISVDTPKLAECLTRNVTRNEFGNVTLFLSILSHTTRLLRAETPHLHQIDGITALPYFKQLSAQIAPRLDVSVPLNKYLVDNVGSAEVNLRDADVNLRLVPYNVSVTEYVKPKDKDWYDICNAQDCEQITRVVRENINRTLVDNDLPALQMQEYWRFPFISRILYHLEHVLRHAARLSGVGSRVDAEGVARGRLDALIDFAMEMLTDDVAGDVVYSLQGLVEELHPLLQNSTLERDLRALSTGLTVILQFKEYLLKEVDLKFEVSQLFSRPERTESALSQLGINNTNFWSVAAPAIQAGAIDLKPLFNNPRQPFHISSYVCDMDTLSTVLHPALADSVSLDDINAAVVDQLCERDDYSAKKMVGVLMANLNFSSVMEKAADLLLPLLYSSANLTADEGATVIRQYPQMAALLPVIQDSAGQLGETIANEPLVQSLKHSSSLGGLLGSPEFLSNAGQMLCGKPFQADTNRFYKAITQSKDYNQAADRAQLDALPTDFCRDLYKDIIRMDGGKIVWSFVKPLIMGKILYTPDTPIVRGIVEQANSTFAHMIKLTSLIHSFSNAFSSIDSLSIHRQGLAAIRGIISSPSFEDLRIMLLGDAPVPDVDVDGLFDDFGDIKSIGAVLRKGSSFLQCVNLNRFRAVADEFQLTHQAVALSRVNEFSAGLVFLNTEGKSDVKNIEYKIRMDIENVPTTARMKNFLWIPGPESSFIEHMRYFRGFIQIQDLIDNAIIQLSRSNSRQKRETAIEKKWAVYTQQEDYPCYKKDFFQTSLYESQALMVALFFSLLFSVASTVRFIVSDKESGNTMLMSVMGVNLTYHTLSWFLSSLLELCVTAAAMAVVLYAGGILPRTDPTLTVAILLVFTFSVLAFCYMVSKLFASASVAAVCAAIAYLMTFMPFVLILSLEAVLSYGLKTIVCLSMSTSICYAFLNITRAEARGVPTHWGDLWRTTDGDLSIGVACTIALIDAGIYVAIGYLLDRWLGPKTQSSVTKCTSTGEKAGVSIANITKIYNQGGRREKMALDNVSIELHQGQITTLLGHNGAGKTTLINILTGMLKPTKGHVIIRSEPTAGTQVGVCPQRDVLFEALTAAEHVALYAQLKSGLPLHMVKDEIESMLRVLSLGPVAGEPVRRLSGGTRRRVCVALAFVARPPLVSLDEPTAGVDPAARRDIWSMIVKLREGRTILLTTHHLDEAELLSDQIVIMHKGQVHTTGSPIEIKRSLGNGYKLSVLYPTTTDSWTDSYSMEERTKQLLAAVRERVSNAGLLDVNGSEVAIALPFFDTNGLNNNYLELCSSLERRERELGYKGFTLDCSTLEQVFFNITQQGEAPGHNSIEYDPAGSSKSVSTSSVRSDNSPLVPPEGPVRGSAAQQFVALLQARYRHYVRNTWLVFLLVALPALFVCVAMAFSLVRPPPDNEVSLALTPHLYAGSTDYLVPHPAVYSNVDPTFAETVLKHLKPRTGTRDWTPADTPNCTCTESKQVCAAHAVSRPLAMVLPDVQTLNEWIVATHDDYIEKRYGGFTSALKNNVTYLVAWYNNKGHHAMPAYFNALSRALLRTVSGDKTANITVYSHPLKISEEQLSKDTVYQHIADAGISALVLIAYALVSGGAAIYLVAARRSQQKRLQLLCGVSPALYWAAAMVADMAIIVINMLITIIVFEAFGFPVFVARNNLPAICLLILLYGFACGSLVHVLEKAFTEPSLANMVLFCGNAFVGLAGITLLLILDIISDSEATDDARWTLHKLLLALPQFALADGMLEVAKNTVQAQVLIRFGMDTYKDPLSSELIAWHYVALFLVGTALTALNLAIEYDYFEVILSRFRADSVGERSSGELEPVEVCAERRRVAAALAGAGAADTALRLPTLGNINAGFVDTEVKNNSIKRIVCAPRDAAATLRLGKAYRGARGAKAAVRDLTIGIPPAQCTALLGQNGAGKSTTFAMLTGETRPTAGQIYLNDKPAAHVQLCNGLISYCPQSDAIDPLLTVKETLQFYCKLRGIEEQYEVIKRTIDMFDLSKYTDVRNGTLSGGNKRKLCTAIAFMGRTPLVLLDEPTSGMDPMARACVSRGVCMALAARRGLLLSTHALGDARRLCARVALLKNGELCALAPLDECLKRFGGGYTICCRSGSPRAVWAAVRAAAPQAKLRVMHHSTLHFRLPTVATVNKKEITTHVSDIFRLMARLQATCDIEDYTLNQTSLDQMFLSFTEKGEEELEPTDLESLPAIQTHSQNELNTIAHEHTTSIFNGYTKRALEQNTNELGHDTNGLGHNTSAHGNNTNELGNDTNGLGHNTSAHGNNTNELGNDTNGLGHNTSAHGNNTNELGNANTSALGNNANAFGNNTNGLGHNMSALGNNTSTHGNNTNELGNNANAFGNNTNGLGHNTSAHGNNTNELGNDNTSALGNNANAFGNNTNGLGNDNTSALGNNANAFGNNTNGLGNDNTSALGNNANAFGNNTNGLGHNTSALGNNTSTHGNNTNELGNDTSALGHNIQSFNEYDNKLLENEQELNSITSL